jgi:hypothetical protein
VVATTGAYATNGYFSGNVGVGTTAPLGKLQISAVTSLLTGGYSPLNIFSTDAIGADKGGRISFGGVSGAVGFDPYGFCAIAGLKDNATASNFAGYLTFSTATSGGTVTERMRIDSSGNVGINTSSPQRPLHVFYSTNTVGAYSAVLQGAGGGYGAGVSFQSVLGGGSLAEMARITADGEGPWNTTASTQDAGLRFYTALDGTVAEKMRIDSSGNTTVTGSILPSTGNTYDLGSTAARWRNIYTNDLQLNNGIGDYTIVEGEDDLFLYNNKKGKVYKFALIEVDPATAPPKAETD